MCAFPCIFRAYLKSFHIAEKRIERAFIGWGGERGGVNPIHCAIDSQKQNTKIQRSKIRKGERPPVVLQNVQSQISDSQKKKGKTCCALLLLSKAVCARMRLWSINRTYLLRFPISQRKNAHALCLDTVKAVNKTQNLFSICWLGAFARNHLLSCCTITEAYFGHTCYMLQMIVKQEQL